MITFEQVSVWYEGAAAPTLSDVSFSVPEGDLCLVLGPTGSGKSTLLGAACGLVPHFSGGRLDGTVTVACRDTRDHHPRDLADVVGVVGQNPVAGFVTGTVEEELAFTMEQLALPPETMRTRVEETLDLLGLAELRGRRLDHLSGGQQQRVAIGAVLTAHPRVLVLDEPTSALDPTAAEEVLATLSRLVADLGVTVLLAEHRLERIVQFADRIVELTPLDPAEAQRGDPMDPRKPRRVRVGSPAQILHNAAVAPPIVELGRVAGWDPLPLSIRDARRQAGDLRDRLATRRPPAPPPCQSRTAEPTGPVLRATGLEVLHGTTVAVRDAAVSLLAGSITGLMGRNGAGKTSLLWALQGSGTRSRGDVAVGGVDPADLSATEARQVIALVPQNPGDLLYHETVAKECEAADAQAGVDLGLCAQLLDRLVPAVEPSTHPRDLSEGQRLGLVLAIQLSGAPSVLALDEPTRGLDYATKKRLTTVLRRLADAGTAVVVSSHDVEFVAGLCDRILVMADGEIIADGPTADVVTASPAFAPQVAKILAPGPWLTVDQVVDALAGTPDPAWPAPHPRSDR